MSERQTVVADLALRLVLPGAAPVPVRARAEYSSHDPFAVHIDFRTSSSEAVAWTFARALLTEGVMSPAGEGDVQVWPSQSNGETVVCLSLSSPSGSALFEVPLSDVVQFLTRTYATVPTGAESDYVDIDAELAMLALPDEG